MKTVQFVLLLVYASAGLIAYLMYRGKLAYEKGVPIVLRIIQNRGGEAYGLEFIKDSEGTFNQSVYSLLRAMEDNELLTSREVYVDEARSDRARYYYSMTKEGELALEHPPVYFTDMVVLNWRLWIARAILMYGICITTTYIIQGDIVFSVVYLIVFPALAFGQAHLNRNSARLSPDLVVRTICSEYSLPSLLFRPLSSLERKAHARFESKES